MGMMDTSTPIAPIDNVFWQFSLMVYQSKSVQELCHTLQDEEGANVNLLLYCCWLAYAMEEVSEQQFHHACQSIDLWHQEVTSTLRQARRALKQWESSHDWVKEFFNRVLVDEILSESYQQSLLYQATADNKKVKPQLDDELAYRYLLWLFEVMGNPVDESKNKLVRELVALVAVAITDAGL